VAQSRELLAASSASSRTRADFSIAIQRLVRFLLATPPAPAEDPRYGLGVMRPSAWVTSGYPFHNGFRAIR
jgi:hypothetical protein